MTSLPYAATLDLNSGLVLTTAQVLFDKEPQLSLKNEKWVFRGSGQPTSEQAVLKAKQERKAFIKNYKDLREKGLIRRF